MVAIDITPVRVYDGAINWGTKVENERKCFHNPRGLEYYYTLLFTADKILLYKSETGETWTEEATIKDFGASQAEGIGYPGVDITYLEDNANSKLICYLTYINGARNKLYFGRFEIADASSSISNHTEQELTVASTPVYAPCICVDVLGYVWIAYTERGVAHIKCTGYTGTHAVCQATTTTMPSGTPTWSGEELVWTYTYAGATDPTFCAIAPLSVDSQVIIVYKYWNAAGAKRLNAKKYSWDGSSFTEDVEGTEQAVGFAATPIIMVVVDSSNVAHVIEQGATTYGTYRRFGAADWTYSASAPANDGITYSLAIDTSTSPDEILLMYRIAIVDITLIHLRKRSVTGTSWGTLYTFDAGDYGTNYHQLAYKQDQDNRIILVYSYLTANDVYFAWYPAPFPPVVKLFQYSDGLTTVMITR